MANMQVSASSRDSSQEMKQKVRTLVTFSRGAGSILDIAPTSNSGRLVPRRSFNQRIHADFGRVGVALRHGIDTVKEETSRDVAPKAPQAIS